MKLWIAREQDGSLWAYANKPILTELGWGVDYDKCDSEPLKQLHESYFPEVTFENSPQQVEIKLVNKL